MGMQYHRHAHVGPEIFWIQPKRFHSAGHTSKQQIVNGCLMMPGQLPEFIGQGDHKILNRQQLGLLALKPLGDLMVLALGTAAVSTGQGPPLGLVARGARLPAVYGIVASRGGRS